MAIYRNGSVILSTSATYDNKLNRCCDWGLLFAGSQEGDMGTDEGVLEFGSANVITKGCNLFIAPAGGESSGLLLLHLPGVPGAEGGIS